MNKDVFIVNHKQSLARRIIAQSATEFAKTRHLEEYLLNKIKLKCGLQYTKDAETMIDDMKHEQQDQIAFSELYAVEAASDDNIVKDVTIRVSNGKAWPRDDIIPQNECNLHPALLKPCTIYEAYFSNLYKKKKLTWLHRWSSATLVFTPRGKSGPEYRIQCNGQQASILLRFDTPTTKLTVRELQENQLGDMVKKDPSLAKFFGRTWRSVSRKNKVELLRVETQNNEGKEWELLIAVLFFLCPI